MPTLSPYTERRASLSPAEKAKQDNRLGRAIQDALKNNTPLAQLCRARNVTEGKVREVCARLGLAVPGKGKVEKRGFRR